MEQLVVPGLLILLTGVAVYVKEVWWRERQQRLKAEKESQDSTET